MHRFILTLFVALLAFPVSAPAAAQEIPAAQQAALVRDIETYLNGITTMRARFEQANQDGSVYNGTFSLWRPGRLRFEYDVPPAADGADYIVADGLLVHYWDHGVKNYSNAPIGSTLADFLLRKKITLSGDLQVAGLRRPRQGYLLLTMVQKENPEAGDVRLLFSENPLRLEKWRVTDGTGNITETSLSAIQSGVRLEPTLFRFRPPKGYDKDWQNLR